MIKCSKCVHFKKYSSGHWVEENCSHEICFIEVIENAGSYNKAKYGSDFKVKSFERVTDFFNLNKDNDCRYFKRAWWRLW